MFGDEQDDFPFGAQAQTDLGVPGVGQQVPAPEAGAAARPAPPKSVLRAELDRSMGFAREATRRLTEYLPAGVAQDQLQMLLESYAVIQENAGILSNRLSQPDLDLVKDMREFNEQVQSFVESSELLLREHVPANALQGLGQNAVATTPTNGNGAPWLLWGAFAVGLGVIAYGVMPRGPLRAR